MSYLLDTNVISEVVKQKPSARVLEWLEAIPNHELYLSALTIGEIRKRIEKVTITAKQAKLRAWLEKQVPDWFGERILPIDQAVAERWGRLQADMKRPIPAVDSLLGATALHFDLALVTRNTEDFQYPGLEVINPWK